MISSYHVATPQRVGVQVDLRREDREAVDDAVAVRERHSLLFLCLSRACLGKRILFSINWRQNGVFLPVVDAVLRGNGLREHREQRLVERAAEQVRLRELRRTASKRPALAVLRAADAQAVEIFRPPVVPAAEQVLAIAGATVTAAASLSEHVHFVAGAHRGHEVGDPLIEREGGVAHRPRWIAVKHRLRGWGRNRLARWRRWWRRRDRRCGRRPDPVDAQHPTAAAVPGASGVAGGGALVVGHPRSTDLGPQARVAAHALGGVLDADERGLRAGLVTGGCAGCWGRVVRRHVGLLRGREQSRPRAAVPVAVAVAAHRLRRHAGRRRLYDQRRAQQQEAQLHRHVAREGKS